MFSKFSPRRNKKTNFPQPGKIITTNRVKGKKEVKDLGEKDKEVDKEMEDTAKGVLDVKDNTEIKDNNEVKKDNHVGASFQNEVTPNNPDASNDPSTTLPPDPLKVHTSLLFELRLTYSSLITHVESLNDAAAKHAFTTAVSKTHKKTKSDHGGVDNSSSKYIQLSMSDSDSTTLIELLRRLSELVLYGDSNDQEVGEAYVGGNGDEGTQAFQGLFEYFAEKVSKGDG